MTPSNVELLVAASAGRGRTPANMRDIRGRVYADAAALRDAAEGITPA